MWLKLNMTVPLWNRGSGSFDLYLPTSNEVRKSMVFASAASCQLGMSLSVKLMSAVLFRLLTSVADTHAEPFCGALLPKCGQ